MKYVRFLKIASSALLGGILFSSCGQVKRGKPAAPKSEKESHLKWLELTKELKLTDNLAEPTKFYETPDEYKDLILQAADRYNRDAFKTRCAAIEGIKPLNIKRHRDVDVYLFEYKLQKNFAGEKEDQTRSAYLTVPRPKENSTNKFPILAYAHGGDTGLSYTKELSKLDKLLEEYIVIAPAFPGETLSSDEEPEDPNADIWFGTDPVGKSIPWANDVDDLLGAHDCLARDIYLHLETPRHMDSEKGRLVKKLSNEINPNNKDEITSVLERIRAKAQTYGADEFQGGVKNYPRSIVMGASRGGLVASIATAKSGSIFTALIGLNSKDKDKKNQSETNSTQKRLMDFATSHGTLSKESISLFESLGDKYGSVPPLFSGLATLSAPATVTIGSFRVILEQMVKGNTDLTVAKHLPGIRNLGHIFDRYLETGDVEEAKFEIVLRDLSFVAPLIIGALKDWSCPTKGGSLLFIHGNKDKVVPVEQTQAAFNIFQNLLEEKTIQEMTMSATGLKGIKRIFDSREELARGTRFHLDDAFENSHSYHYSHLFQDRTLKAVMSSSKELAIPKFIDDIKAGIEMIPGLEFMMPNEVANFKEVQDLYALASSVDKMREQKIKSLQESMNHIVEASQNQTLERESIDGEEHIAFSKDDIPSRERILQMLILADALESKEFVEKHLKSEKLLHLAVLYQISNGGFRHAGKGLKTGFAPKAVQLISDKGEEFLSLKESHGPYHVVEAWGKMLKQ